LSSVDLRRKGLRAFVMVKVKPGTSEEIVKSRRIKGVKMANSVLGRFDAIAIIETPNLESVNEILYKVIETDPNIIHTETSLAL